MAKKYLPNTKLVVVERIAKLDDTSRIEVSLVQKAPVTDDNEYFLDIRQWSVDHSKCTFGVTLTIEQAYELLGALADHFEIPLGLESDKWYE